MFSIAEAFPTIGVIERTCRHITDAADSQVYEFDGNALHVYWPYMPLDKINLLGVLIGEANGFLSSQCFNNSGSSYKARVIPIIDVAQIDGRIVTASEFVTGKQMCRRRNSRVDMLAFNYYKDSLNKALRCWEGVNMSTYNTHVTSKWGATTFCITDLAPVVSSLTRTR